MRSQFVCALMVFAVGCGGDKKNSAAPASTATSIPSGTAGAPSTDSGSPASSNPCGIHTDYPGDDACLLPPDPSEGFQIHVGPSDYTDTVDVSRFLLQPGDEKSECWSFHTPNDAAVFYQSFELNGRPGTHHIINTVYSTDVTDGGFTVCRDAGIGSNSDIISGLPGASRPRTPREAVAPENAHVASIVPAHGAGQADMHYFNLTGAPILREFWLNIYSVPKEQVTTASAGIRGMGGLSWLSTPIPPQSHNTYQYTCPISGGGRVLELLGHTHAHSVRETAWIHHASGERTKVFEQYDYKEPQIFYYDSITKNPDFSTTAPGAFTGMLNVVAGDALDWECEVNNDSDHSLSYVNEVQTGEMCNIWGVTVGPQISCVLP